MQIQNIQSAQLQQQKSFKTREPLEGVQAGDRLSAEVTKSEGGKVTLTLLDGTTLTASAQAHEQLLVGDTVLLEVKSTGAQETSLKLVEINGQSLGAEVTELTYALMRMNVPAGNAQVAYASTLRDLGVQLTPSLLSKMDQVSAQFPGLSLSEAALFAVSELPVTADNVEKFQAFLKSPVQTADFADAIAAMAKKEPALVKPFLNALEANAPAQQPDIDGVAMRLGATDARMAGVQASNGESIIMPEGQPLLKESIVPLPENLTPGTAEYLKNSGEYETLIRQAPQWSEAKAHSEILSFMTALPKETPLSDRQILSAALFQARQAPMEDQAEKQPVLLKQAPQEAELTDPARQSAPQTAEKAQAGNSGEGLSTLGAEIHQAQPQPQATIQDQAQLVKVARDLFAFMQEGALPEEQAASLKEAATSLPTKVVRLSDALKAAEGQFEQAKSILDTGNALVTQLHMGGELGNLLYAQIPFLNAQQQPQSAELYMLKRDGGRRTVDEANATVALCLETMRLGRLETLLHVEQNELSIQFRVENEDILQYVKKQLPSLSRLSFPAQYHLRKTGAVLQKDRITPENAAKTMKKVFNVRAATGMIDMTV
ncbi:hypothetical protein LJC27_08525 [Christensenellaceae bacterium OttesenSCG-928-M15]|nr:hypothetical protein [Christensenellaceae bacterium OttesenSCG-928-M15]